MRLLFAGWRSLRRACWRAHSQLAVYDDGAGDWAGAVGRLVIIGTGLALGGGPGLRDVFSAAICFFNAVGRGPQRVPRLDPLFKVFPKNSSDDSLQKPDRQFDGLGEKVTGWLYSLQQRRVGRSA